MSQIFKYIESALDAEVVVNSRVGGGDFAEAFHIRLNNEQELFVKTHSNPPAFFFTTEATGLQWLGKGQVAVPQVILVSDEPPLLALEWIDIEGSGMRGHSSTSQSARPVQPTRSVQSGEEAFGRGMAALHQLPFEYFGRPDGRTTGSLALPNTVATQWPDFFSSCRLLPLVDKCKERNTIASETLRGVERIASRLHEFGAADEPPSLLHGDLWAGNRMIDCQGQSWLIDPAAHGGHREFDLAMMRLFGGFGEQCFSAYNEVFPLQPGWQQRVQLHQLAPLLVHAIKFGGHYVSAVSQVVAELE